MVDTVLTDYLHYIRYEKRYSTHTQIAYENNIREFIAFLETEYYNLSIKEVSHYHIRTWLSQLKSSGQKTKTINRKLSSLSNFFRFLLTQKQLTQNPLKSLHSLRINEERLPQFIKEKEAESLLENVDFDEGFKGMTDRLICDILYQTGIRRSELIDLKENNIEWSLCQMRVMGKGSKDRLIPLSESLLSSLKAYLADKKTLELTFCNNLLILENGKPLYPGYVYRIVHRYLATVTTIKKKSPHIMRHSFATHLLNNGANIQAIKELLGHSSLAATQVYTHINIEKLKEIHKLNHPKG